MYVCMDRDSLSVAQAGLEGMRSSCISLFLSFLSLDNLSTNYSVNSQPFQVATKYNVLLNLAMSVRMFLYVSTVRFTES